jgi:diguanylate cyclase (GGDEF)-like protein/PAS domain S-box-containing protein
MLDLEGTGALAMLRVLVEGPLPFLMVSAPEGRVLVANAACRAQLGVSEDVPLEGLLVSEVEMTWKLGDGDGVPMALEDSIISRALRGELVRNREFQLIRADGSERWALGHGGPVMVDGRQVAAFATFSDITEQRRLTEELARREQVQSDLVALLRATLESTADGILVADLRGRITGWNQRLLALWGIEEASLKGGDCAAFMAMALSRATDPDAFAKLHALAADQEGHDFVELKDGRIFERTLQPQRLDGEVIGRLWSFRDVTERRRAEQEIHRLAFHDALTGLPNRRLFEDRFVQALAMARRHHEKVALLNIDLDRFKQVNDTYGHDVGDDLLVQITQRVSEGLRKTDTLCRQGGDEFLVALPELKSLDQAELVAGKLIARLTDPFDLKAVQWNASFSIGIAVYPDHGEDFSTLMKRADEAMFKAKRGGRGIFAMTGND